MQSWFPTSYVDSRKRFIEAASALGAALFSYPVDVASVPDLSIDVAIIGPSGQPAVVISSGVHGVEGPCGAAVQLTWMANQLQKPVSGRFVLIHALNPYGYAMGRRVNEDNVDLNRNFTDTDASARSNVQNSKMQNNDYERFDALLNPKNPPRRFDAFLIKALGYLVREGKQRLQGAIVTGQYEFPLGLFYGGNGRSCTFDIVQNNIEQWVGDAHEIRHLDFHTGLGRSAQCQLLVQALPDSSEYHWCEKTFLGGDVVPTTTTASDAYQATGAMGNWLTQRFEDRPYRFVTAEFGTYSSLKVLGALRAENQAFHFAPSHSAIRARARRQLEDCFCPQSLQWQRAVVEKGLKLIEQAALA